MSRGTALLRWYRTGARPLPWRRNADPYRILVSEVMLQQTQAARVVDHFDRFVARFPTVEALAAASAADVIAAWIGLGYNGRALRLHRAAGLIVEEGWPTTAADLRRLPGVGAYTGAAVAAIAFEQRVAPVDTNVRRVVQRWEGRELDDPAIAAAAQNAITGPPGEWAQAMMELGALVCRPEPQCSQCPVSAWCRDPSIYTPPRRQAAFPGSVRAARGAIVRALGDGSWAPVKVVRDQVGDDDRFDRALVALASEGMIELQASRMRLARATSAGSSPAAASPRRS